jgi:Putative restriction endonuclease
MIGEGKGRAKLILPRFESIMSVTVVVDSQPIVVPDRAKSSIQHFRHWAGSHQLPEKCVVLFHNGHVSVDVSREQIFTHADVKTEFASVLHRHAKLKKRGRYFANGVLVTNLAAGLSVNPDGTFVSHEAFHVGRVSLVEGAEVGYTELEGTPDMVLEIVSSGSVKKDTVTLKKAYWDAGISEYWLVDARADEPIFHVYRHGPIGYIDTRKVAGWLKSNVFDASFRLVKGWDENENPVFTLEMRP